MSAPIQNESEDRGRDAPSMFGSTSTMYAPPWARDAATDAADAALAATDKLRRVLPAAPLLRDPEVRTRKRDAAPFEGDLALRELRARPSLDPVAVPEPPARARGSSFPVLARVSGAIGLAALAAFFMVGTAPGSLKSANGVDAGTKPFWSRMFGADVVRETLTAPKPVDPRRIERAVEQPVPMMERFAAATPAAEQPPVAAPQSPQVAVAPSQAAVAPPQVAEPPAPPAPRLAPQVRTLDREEIAALYRRGEQLITQGDIAAARLMFLRAAEVGDARSALALGASYDPEVLRKLGVLGVAADAALAREWYSKASGFGSREAAQRIELMAQGR